MVPGVLFMYASRVRAQLSGILLRYRQPLGEKGAYLLGFESTRSAPDAGGADGRGGGDGRGRHK